MAMQPTIAHIACGMLAKENGGVCSTKYIVFPHGSAIEFTLRPDERYRKLALEAVLSPHCAGMISGNNEVLNRILRIYTESAAMIVAKTRIVGVGTDTTLFQPRARSTRPAAMASLLETVALQVSSVLATYAAAKAPPLPPAARNNNVTMSYKADLIYI